MRRMKRRDRVNHILEAQPLAKQQFYRFGDGKQAVGHRIKPREDCGTGAVTQQQQITPFGGYLHQ